MTETTLQTRREKLDPKLDVVFSFLFGAEQNRHLLVALLDSVLQLEAPIVSVELLPPRPDVQDAEEKVVALDIRARLVSGEYVDVEMQTRRHPALRERVLFYWGRMYTGQVRRGRPYSGLRRCIVVLIADFVEFESGDFHSVFQVLERKTGKLFSSNLEVHLLELPKIRDAFGGADEPELLAWCKFLSADTDEQLEALAMQYPIFKYAKDALEDLSGDPEVRELAVRRELELQLREQAETALREKGRQEGLVEGALSKAKQTITTLLNLKFGALPPELQTRVDAATESDLDRWLGRTLTADSLETVFDSLPSARAETKSPT
jgi:predicted transposase/invertase (TIGR01784 family)